MSSIVGAEAAVAKSGDEVEVCVNAEPGELEQEMRLAERRNRISGWNDERNGIDEEIRSLLWFPYCSVLPRPD